MNKLSEDPDMLYPYIIGTKSASEVFPEENNKKLYLEDCELTERLHDKGVIFPEEHKDHKHPKK